MVLTSPTPGAVFTTKDQSGSVVVVTYAPGGGTVSQVRYGTTTLPNGSQAVVTSFATVGAPVPTTDEPAGSKKTDGATLQKGAAVRSNWYSAEMALMVAALVGAAGVVF